MGHRIGQAATIAMAWVEVEKYGRVPRVMAHNETGRLPHSGKPIGMGTTNQHAGRARPNVYTQTVGS